MADTITISKDAANAIRYLVEDIINVHERANCSDKFFRTHFMNVVQAGIINGAYKELYDALSDAEETKGKKAQAKWN